jgi:hypothetical protein
MRPWQKKPARPWDVMGCCRMPAMATCLPGWWSWRRSWGIGFHCQELPFYLMNSYEFLWFMTNLMTNLTISNHALPVCLSTVSEALRSPVWHNCVA